MEPGSEARRLISAAEGLILDFDGPMCDVFADTAASVVAAELRSHMGLTDFASDDPLAVLDAVQHRGGDVEAAHAWLTAREVEVVESAVETDGLRELISQFDGPIAVASNNAAAAIHRWLDLAGLNQLVAHVEGRDPMTMKPHPRSLVASAGALGLNRSECCFIGDSVSDGVAAKKAGVGFVGLIVRQSKVDRFAAAGLDVVVGELRELMS